MRAPNCCSDRSSVCEVSCVILSVATEWVTEEGGFLVVEAALQICHELHGCCAESLILFSSRSVQEIFGKKVVFSSERSCLHSHAVRDAVVQVWGCSTGRGRSALALSPADLYQGYHPVNQYNFKQLSKLVSNLQNLDRILSAGEATLIELIWWRHEDRES